MIEYFVDKGLFKNANHAIWFLNSIFFLIFVILLHWNKFGFWIIFLPIIFHISPIVTSIKVNYFLKKDSEIYSKDCIWFNAVMIVFYVILMLVF